MSALCICKCNHFYHYFFSTFYPETENKFNKKKIKADHKFAALEEILTIDRKMEEMVEPNMQQTNKKKKRNEN